MNKLVRMVSGGVAFIGLCIGGFGMTIYEPLDGYPWRILVYGAGLGVVLILLLFGMALAVRRFITQAFPLRALLNPFPALALLVVGCGVMATINGVLDFQEPQVYETVVVSKDQRGGSNSAAWFKIRDFRPGREDELLTVAPGELFDQVNEGDRIIVVAGRGLIEWWLEGIRLPEQPHQLQSSPDP